MSILLYKIFIQLYILGIKILSIRNQKAKLWLKGRKAFPVINLLEKQPVSWMHCASLGEYEQGRPVIAAVKAQYPETVIVLTFVSPSGFEIQKKYAGADYIFYLPVDSASNAKKFIDNINPTLVLWVKYEYWFYYLTELKQRRIPVLLLSGIFRNSQPFFQWYGKLWKSMLASFNHFFVQTEQSKDLLAGIHIKENVSVSGDTRFDRVVTIAEKFNSIPFIEAFCGIGKVIVAGSTWDDDEAVLAHYAKTNPGIKFIIAPHEIGEENLKDIKTQFPSAIFYSELELNKNKELPNCLIIDNIGMLSRIYKYATIAYVGGAFAEGLHNILEAAVIYKKRSFKPIAFFISFTGDSVNRSPTSTLSSFNLSFKEVLATTESLISLTILVLFLST
ncbi:MAG: 3-deoxy-D-manno-octulosonic acid transferase [Sphingobacteriales bacterium]|nr:3-deoxy-D-manno-octulosonic acid transferase [Sphingobacteriales bacterium]